MIRPNQVIQVEQFQVKLGNMIDKDSFSVTYKGEMNNGQVVAVQIQQQMSENEKQILTYLKGIQFEHIIHVIAFEEKQDASFIITEFWEHIEFNQLPDKRKVCLQMAKGVSQLHNIGYFHRDIKPNNFVMGNDNKIKLKNFQNATTTQQRSKTIQIGTLSYMAPEVYRNSDYDCSVDIWSLGILYYELFENKQFLGEELQFGQICTISQQQINQILSSKTNLEKWQQELLSKMMIQRLDNQGRINRSISRINIDELINQLEKLNNQDQSKQQDQGFDKKEDLYQILICLKEIDVEAFNVIIDVFRQQKSSDIIEFLSKEQNPKYLAKFGQKNINTIINVIKSIKQHQFNKIKYSIDNQEQYLQELINKISKEEKIIKFLKFLAQLKDLDNQFIQSGSNSLDLLVEMLIQLSKKK